MRDLTVEVVRLQHDLDSDRGPPMHRIDHVSWPFSRANTYAVTLKRDIGISRPSPVIDNVEVEHLTVEVRRRIEISDENLEPRGHGHQSSLAGDARPREDG